MGFCRTLTKAIDGTRTRGFHLGKVALYQLSHYRISLKPVCFGQKLFYYKASRMSTLFWKNFKKISKKFKSIQNSLKYLKIKSEIDTCKKFSYDNFSFMTCGGGDIRIQ